MKEVTMYIFRATILCLSVIGIGLFQACDENNDTPVDDVKKGDISGVVNLYDDGENRAEDNGMIVSVIGSNPMISDTTDIEGNFVLQGVRFGSHALEYRKEGYGTHKVFDVEHLEERDSTILAEIPQLGKISTTEILQLDALVTEDTVYISFTTEPGGTEAIPKHASVLFDATNTVDATKFSIGLKVSPIPFNPAIISIPIEQLITFGFEPGKELFVRVFGDSFHDNKYFDPDLDKDVLPNLNPKAAPEIAFILPE